MSRLRNILAGWAAASRSGDEACPGESQTGPGEHCIEDEEEKRTPGDDEEKKKGPHFRAPLPALKVKPRKGAALIFYGARPDGTPDWLAWHGSCPVEKGTKWIAQKWVRMVPRTFFQDPNVSAGAFLAPAAHTQNP